MKKELLTLSTAIMLLATPAKAQNCAVPPTCESLGYSKTANECTGLDILRCPFDNTKVFCTQGYKVQAAIGDILFSDMTTSSNPITGKTPIGIVFDSTQRLAVALTVKESRLYTGQQYSRTFYFSPTSEAGNTLTADLPRSLVLTPLYYNVNATGNGKTNTELLDKHIANYITNLTKAMEDFITPLQTAIQTGWDTYVEEVRNGCSGCSENDIQNQARNLQGHDSGQLYAFMNEFTNFTAPLDRLENPFKDVLEYKTDGTNAGDWFIPSQQELNLIGMNFNLILDSFLKAKVTFSRKDVLYISSTLSDINVQGIELDYYCSTSYNKRQCTYASKSISRVPNNLLRVNYFPVIKF